MNNIKRIRVAVSIDPLISTCNSPLPMPITLISGPINSGKTEKILDLLVETDTVTKTVIIAPDRTIAESIRRRIASRTKNQFTAIQTDSVQDWRGFVRTLARPELPVATRAESIMITAELLTELKLKYFGPATRSYSLARRFSDTIIRLKENLIRPPELMEAIADTGLPCIREQDLVTIYDAYEKRLTKLELLDEGDLTLLAIKAAIEGRAFGLTTVIFDEFVMPTPAQLALIRALRQGEKEIDVFATCTAAKQGEDAAYSSYLERARDTWLSACDAEEKLATRTMKSPKVDVIRATSPLQEARHAARIIVESGFNPADIVVGIRDKDSFLEWYLSEAHSMGLLPEHPTLDGAIASPLAHEILSGPRSDSLPCEASVTEFANAVRNLARMSDRGRSWIDGLKQRHGRGRVAARSLTAVSIIDDVLRSLCASATTLNMKRIERGLFVNLMADALANHKTTSTMLGSVLPFRAHRLGLPMTDSSKLTIIPRAIDGAFPGRATETLFFADWKDESIRRIFPDAEDMHAKESFAFESMLKKTSATLKLIMPAIDDSGSETIPSSFADRFLSGDDGSYPLAPITLDPAEEILKQIEDRIAIEAARIAGEDPDGSASAQYMGNLCADKTRSLVKERFCEEELSPTSLEDYANCPFSFFVKKVLRIAEPAEDTPEMRAPDRGRIVHEILMEFYRDHAKDAVAARSDPAAEKRIAKTVEAIARRIWDEKKDEMQYVKPGLRNRELDDITKMALSAVAAETAEAKYLSSPLVPREFEWKFGKAEGNALEIHVKGGPPVSIGGRVDRVDADKGGEKFLVIDYKTGKVDPIVGKIEDGRHMQLPLYIEAVKGSLMPDALPLGGLFLEIKNTAPSGDDKKTEGKTKGLVLKQFDNACYRVGRSQARVEPDRMHDLINAAKAKAAEFATEIRCGRFPVSADAKCEYCDYGDICRYKKTRTD